MKDFGLYNQYNLLKSFGFEEIPHTPLVAMYEGLGKSLLIGRVGEAQEIERAYLFLMQEGYSTGQVGVVDGGGLLV
jgi:NAD(P)-dependent dehydrogenase (short-subunit alcohol dehydrogenase family)